MALSLHQLIDLSKEIAEEYSIEADKLLCKAVDLIRKQLKNPGQTSDIILTPPSFTGIVNQQLQRCVKTEGTNVCLGKTMCGNTEQGAQTKGVVKTYLHDSMHSGLIMEAHDPLPQSTAHVDGAYPTTNSDAIISQECGNLPGVHEHDQPVHDSDNCIHLSIQQDDGMVANIKFEVINKLFDENMLGESLTDSEGHTTVTREDRFPATSVGLITSSRTTPLVNAATQHSVKPSNSTDRNLRRKKVERNETFDRKSRKVVKDKPGRPRSRLKPAPIINEKGEEVYQCEICKAFLRQYHGLLVHMRSHSGDRPFECEICHKSFTTKGNKEYHVKHTHSNIEDKPFACDECGKRFNEKKVLKVHTRIHTGERPYCCPVCDQSFTQSGVLKEHMLIHTDKKPHLCHLCGQSFRSASNLKIHRLRHLNEKAHQCGVCDKAFVSSGALRKHSISHTGERKYKCDICQKTFAYLNSLKQHKQVNHPTALLICDVCNLTFSDIEAFNKHNSCHAVEKAAKALTEQTGLEFLANHPGMVTTETVYYSANDKVLGPNNKQTPLDSDETYSVHILVNEGDLESYQSVLVSAAAIGANMNPDSRADGQTNGQMDSQLDGSTQRQLYQVIQESSSGTQVVLDKGQMEIMDQSH